MLYLHNIINGVWFIERSFAMNYFPIVLNWLTEPHGFNRPRNALDEENLSSDNAVSIAVIKNDTYQVSDYGEYAAPEDAPKNSVAIMNINGVITKYDQDCGPSGMQTKSNILRRCYANDNIKAVVINIDSGGGDANAMFLMNSAIAERNKPVVAFCNDVAASAAYGIASSCDKVIANSDICEVGSVGTFMTVADFRQYYEMKGIKVQDIYATKSSDKNKPYKEAINGNPDPVREICDEFNEHFIGMVQQSRNEFINKDQKTWATGKLFFAKEALENGLIDGIDTLQNVLNYFNT